MAQRLDISPLDPVWAKIGAHLSARINEIHTQLEHWHGDPAGYARLQGRIAEIRALIDMVEVPERPTPEKPAKSLYS